MLREAVDSALKQSYRPIEVIIVDDGSTDDTPATIRQLVLNGDGLVKSFSQPNAGPGVARNTGLSQSTGDYIQYLDSDDLLFEDKLQLQVESLANNAEAGVSYCTTLRTCPDTSELRPWAKTATRISNIFPSFLPERGWATLTPLWRRSVCNEIGPWKPFRMMEDWEHDLRAGMIGVVPVQVCKALCLVRDHGEPRASGMNVGFTSERVEAMFRAHESVWSMMKERGHCDWSYLNHYSRSMFLISRLCGRHGLIEEAESALKYVGEMIGTNGQSDFTRSFRVLRAVLGWPAAVKVGEAVRNNRMFAELLGRLRRERL